MQATENAVFTTVKVVEGRPHHLGLHVERLRRSASIVGLDSPAADAVRRAVDAALSDPATVLARALGRMRVAWDGNDLAVTVEPLAPHPATTTVLRSPDLRDPATPTAGAKTAALGRQGRALVAWAHEHGAGDAILATTDGLLAEGATSNVFYVVGGELRTPTERTGLLGGIARRLLLDATDAREVDAAYEVLWDADEVFLTSSLRGVQTVTAVDGRPIAGPGPVTRTAARVWDALPTDD